MIIVQNNATMQNEKPGMKKGFSAILSSWHICSFLLLTDFFFQSFIFYNRDTNIHLQHKKIPHIIPSNSHLYYKRDFSKGALVLLGIIELIGRSAASAYAFSSLNQFTMMNGPHLAPQLALCWVLSLCLCLSLSLRWESCLQAVDGCCGYRLKGR